MKELWLPVPGQPQWLASSFGRVMVRPRLCPTPHGSSAVRGGKPTHGVWDGNRFVIQRGGKNHKVARLVCAAFHGHQPDSKSVVMHLDEDARNNRPENLAWGTQKENLNAPGFLAYCKGRTGERSPSAVASRRRAAINN